MFKTKFPYTKNNSSITKKKTHTINLLLFNKKKIPHKAIVKKQLVNSTNKNTELNVYLYLN